MPHYICKCIHICKDPGSRQWSHVGRFLCICDLTGFHPGINTLTQEPLRIHWKCHQLNSREVVFHWSAENSFALQIKPFQTSEGSLWSFCVTPFPKLKLATVARRRGTETGHSRSHILLGLWRKIWPESFTENSRKSCCIKQLQRNVHRIEQTTEREGEGLSFQVTLQSAHIYPVTALQNATSCYTGHTNKDTADTTNKNSKIAKLVEWEPASVSSVSQHAGLQDLSRTHCCVIVRRHKCDRHFTSAHYSPRSCCRPSPLCDNPLFLLTDSISPCLPPSPLFLH